MRGGAGLLTGAVRADPDTAAQPDPQALLCPSRVAAEGVVQEFPVNFNTRYPSGFPNGNYLEGGDLSMCQLPRAPPAAPSSTPLGGTKAVRSRERTLEFSGGLCQHQLFLASGWGGPVSVGLVGSP